MSNDTSAYVCECCRYPAKDLASITFRNHGFLVCALCRATEQIRYSDHAARTVCHVGNAILGAIKQSDEKI